MEQTELPDIKTLVPWYGSDRMIGKYVGEELAGCSWVGIPFAGGMGVVLHLDARTILVNDMHRWVINLASVIADPDKRRALLNRLKHIPFHPDVLARSQTFVRYSSSAGIDAAEAYFICAWMGRSGNSGTPSELNGNLAIRWDAGGGDSATRYYNAIRSMVLFGRSMRRCTFEVGDAFDLLATCKDADGFGIYGDSPFPMVGRKYTFNAGKTDADERAWHTAYRNHLERFTKTRCVVRFYDHPLIRELYSTDRWTWRFLSGRDQHNSDKSEVLLINGPSNCSEADQ